MKAGQSRNARKAKKTEKADRARKAKKAKKGRKANKAPKARKGVDARRAAGADPLYELCRSLPGTTEDVKWGSNLIFSVGGKMYAGFQLPEGEPVGLKVDEALFASLVRRPGISPAPYLAKHSWVELESRAALAAPELRALLRAAHERVAAGLPRKRRAELGIETEPSRAG
jgi:predicted DNA-binding protein (MmcQ/YjbR family)